MDNSIKDSYSKVITDFLYDFHNNQNFRNFQVSVQHRHSMVKCKITVDYPVNSILEKNVTLFKMLVHQKRVFRDLSRYFGFNENTLRVISCVESSKHWHFVKWGFWKIVLSNRNPIFFILILESWTKVCLNNWLPDIGSGYSCRFYLLHFW